MKSASGHALLDFKDEARWRDDMADVRKERLLDETTLERPEV
jgi:hypothetical protein